MTSLKTLMTRVLAVVSLAALTACATQNKMAYNMEEPAGPTSGNPVYLMTLTMRNVYKTNHQPKLFVAHVEKPGAQGKADRLNFKMDDLGRMETNSMGDGNSYLVRMELPPGQWELVGMTSMVQSFPLVGTFFTPIHADLNVSKPGTYYLGHVEATVRERQGNEFKAGASVPLVDQSLVGASGGTFDVVISDAFDKDLKNFQATFPAMRSATVERAVLPPFDRARAQKWWEDH